MMFCFICCVFAIGAAVVCLYACKECRKDCDVYRERWLKSEDRVKEVISKCEETIKLCEKLENTSNAIIKCNENLIDANADLRLEVEAMKEKYK